MAQSVDVAGVSIPKLGMGTWQLDDGVCVEAVAAAIGLGYRHIDTAEMYQNEVAVGEGIRAAEVSREKIFVTSKVWHDHLAEGVLQAAAEASLKRLGLDQLDLYLIHWPSEETPLSEAMAALCSVKQRGLARAIGVSNFPPAHLREALACSTEPLAVNQVEYHPFFSQAALLSQLRAAGMGLTAYCPLARGEVLTDPVIAAIAKRHGVTSVAVALAWLVAQDGVIAIPRSRSRARLAENLAALDLTLSAEDTAAINGLARPGGRLVNPAFAPDWAAA